MKPIKVLHLTPPGFGGIDAYIFSHYKYMDRSEFQFDFLTQNADLAHAEQYREFSYRVWPLTVTANQDKDAFAQHVRNVLGYGYDILHLHTSYWTGFLIEELAKEAGIQKVIVHAHSSSVEELDDEKRVRLLHSHEKIKQSFLPDLATDFWACTWLAANWLFGPQIPRERIRIMKNAIDLERFRFDQQVRTQVRDKLGIKESTLVLGTTGRLSYAKNHAFLVELFRVFHRTFPDSKLIIVGDGELRSGLEVQLKESGLANSVLLPGWQPLVERYLFAMDCFLLPSRFEGLGIAVVEAAVSGLPCIVSDRVPGEAAVSETVRHVPLNIPDWIGALEEMMRLNIDRRRGVETVRAAGYDVRQQAKVLEEFYKEV